MAMGVMVSNLDEGGEGRFHSMGSGGEGQRVGS